MRAAQEQHYFTVLAVAGAAVVVAVTITTFLFLSVLFADAVNDANYVYSMFFN